MAIGWGVVSLGNFPNTRVAPAIGLAEDAELVAVYSRDSGRAEAFAREHNALAAYSSVEALLDDSRVDVVWICSPNHLHALYTKMAAQAGKQVLVEKPMAVSVDEAVDMVSTCRQHGVKLGVGFHLRHHPGHIEAKRLIDERVVGTIALAQAQMGAGIRGEAEPPPRTGLNEWWDIPEMVGGATAMMAMGVHCVDILRFFLGQEVVEVAAMTDGHTQERPLDNLTTMCLRFSDGAIGMVATGRRMPDSKNDAVIYGSNGRIVIRDSVTGPLRGDLEVVSDTVNTTASYRRDDLGCYKLQVEAFNKAIRNDEEPSASGLDGVRVVQATVAMIESATTGRTVKIEPVSV